MITKTHNLNEIDEFTTVKLDDLNEFKDETNNGLVEHQYKFTVINDVNEMQKDKQNKKGNMKYYENIIFNVFKLFTILSIALVCLLGISYILILIFLDIYMSVLCKNNMTFEIKIVNITDIQVNNDEHIKFNYFFLYHNVKQNITKICYDENCVNQYAKYNIGNNITLYLQNETFKFDIDIGPCIGLIFVFPTTLGAICFFITSPFILYFYVKFKTKFRLKYK